MAQQATVQLRMPSIDGTIKGTFDLDDEGQPLDSSRPVATSNSFRPDGSQRKVEVFVVVTDTPAPEEAPDA